MYNVCAIMLRVCGALDQTQDFLDASDTFFTSFETLHTAFANGSSSIHAFSLGTMQTRLTSETYMLGLKVYSTTLGLMFGFSN